MPERNKPLPKPWLTEKKAQEGRTVDNSKFYQSHKWRLFRKRYLQLYPLCAICEASDKVNEAKVLDHVLAIRQGGAAWSYENLQGLCVPCHAKKSGQEAHD